MVLWPFRTVLSTIQRELSLAGTLAHRAPGVSCILEGTSSCVPLRTAACANLDPQCWGPLLFLLMWGEGLLCTSFLLYPVCASEQGFHSPRGGPRLSLGPFHQGSLEERENDLGGSSPGLVPIATVWFKVSGGEAILAHSHLVRALPTLKQLPWAFSSCLDPFSVGAVG